MKSVAKRPATGGESCKTGFFVLVIQQKSPFRYNIVVQAILLRKVEKYIYGESNGLWYELQGDYLIPCIALPAEEKQPIGTWGQRHLDYLKQYRKVTYTNLLTSGRLNAYLADIDRQAQERFERLIEGMKRNRHRA